MSIFTDGIFFYGMAWQDSEPPWRPLDEKELGQHDRLTESPEWEDIYCLRSGKPKHDARFRIGVHASYEAPMYFLAVVETLVKADRGYPEKARTVTVKDEWRSQLEQFCAIMGIKWQEPAWWVASIYG